MKNQDCSFFGASKCPDDALLLKLENTGGITQGFLVYPDGNFVYQNYPLIIYLDKWIAIQSNCTYYNTQTPFKIIRE